MQFQLDEAKQVTNIEKHGFDLFHIQQLFEGNHTVGREVAARNIDLPPA